jgi:hypothetical protein
MRIDMWTSTFGRQVKCGLSAIILIGSATGCPSPPIEDDANGGFVDTDLDINPTPEFTTDRRMRLVAGGITDFVELRGRRPTALSEIVGLPVEREVLIPKAYWLEDGWGREFRFSDSDTTFEIRSAGPDGMFGTEEDVVLVRAWP